MKIKYIPVILLFASLAAAPDMPCAGGLLPLADALEDMADMSRAAYRASESMRNVMNDGYHRDYGRDYYRDKEYRKRWHNPPHPSWNKKYHKYHKKYYRHYKKRHHHDDYDGDDD